MSAAAGRAASLLEFGRTLAVARGASFRVEADPARGIRLVCAGDCSGLADGQPWVGPGTDGAGWHGLGEGVRPRLCWGRPVAFTPLGEAAPAGTLRLDGPGGRRLDVVVDPAGSSFSAVPGSCD